MPDFLSMLRSRPVFSRPGGVRRPVGSDMGPEADTPLGMPRLDNSSVAQMLHSGISAAETMKRNDLNRQKELMTFQAQLQRQQQAAKDVQAGQSILPKSNAKKDVQVRYAGPTNMQRQFQAEAQAERQNKNMMERMKLQNEIGAEQEHTQNRFKAENDLSERYAKEDATKVDQAFRSAEAEKARIAAQKIAETNASAKTKPGDIVNVRRPGGQPDDWISGRVQPDGSIKPLKIHGEEVGPAYKPGSKLPDLTPEAKDSIGLGQRTLDVINKKLLTADNQLTDEAKWATGATSVIGKIPLLPTWGKAGQAHIRQVASQQVLELIGKLKAQSRTGATGMGNMSNQDRQVLESAASVLNDPSLPEETIREELVNIKQLIMKMNRTREQMGAAELANLGESPNQAPTAAMPNQDPRARTPDSVYKQFGG